MGIGIGIMITCLLIISLGYRDYSDYEIEKKASELGMIYPDEVRALRNENVGSDNE